MKNVGQYVVAGAVAFVILTAGLLGSARIKKWESQRQTYEDSLLVIRHDNKLLLANNQNLQISLDGMQARVITKIKVIHVAQARVDATLPASAFPDTCARPILARDSIIDSLNIVINTLQSGWDQEKQIGAKLARQLFVSDSMLGAGKTLLDKAPIHKTFLGRLVPHFGFGVAAGVDVTGRPNAVAGVILSW